MTPDAVGFLWVIASHRLRPPHHTRLHEPAALHPLAQDRPFPAKGTDFGNEIKMRTGYAGDIRASVGVQIGVMGWRGLKRRQGYSATRWVRLALLGVFGAALFEAVLPVAWAYVFPWKLPYTPAFELVLVALATFLLFYLIAEPLRIRSGHWRRFFWYPPVWVAPLVSLGLAAVSERLPEAFRPQMGGPDWMYAYPVVPALGLLALALALRQLPFRWRAKPSGLTEEARSALTWPVIEAWIHVGERPARPDEADLFGHRPIAVKLTELLAQGRHSVALLGPFGSGKTTIVETVCAELAKKDALIMVARLDMWAIPNPEDVPRLALQQIIGALDDYVDTTALRGLPASYQRLAAAEPTGRLSNVLGAGGAGDSIEELTKLTPILEALDARAVLIIEDAERAGEGFETRHIERLLSALKKLDRLSFVLAVDPRHAKFDFAKLCETIELIPPLGFPEVFEILMAAYEQWRGPAFAFIDPHPRRQDGDKLGLARASLGGVMEYVRRTGRNEPLDALIELLESPRAFKLVLRRVDRIWQALHGEAELDDIVIVAALRHAAPDAFNFLLRDIDPARRQPDTLLPRTQTVKEAWDAVVPTLPHPSAVQRLVDLLGIEQLKRGRGFTGSEAPQGVHVAEPVDYFRRIVAEGLEPGDDLRDQEVLRDIQQWDGGKTDDVPRRLSPLM